jgi:succinate-semialdehyde dehydrogenase / glutarate-semialdehyde dehydrogenase
MAEYPQLKMHIDGEWIGPEGRETHKVVNPATGAVLGALPLATKADLDRALAAAEQGFKLWRSTTADERASVMRKAAALIRERLERIARIATMEEGKTLAEMRIETGVAASCIEWFGEEGRRAYGRVLVRQPGVRSLVLKQPVGPVAAFAPWNFPVGNPARKLGASLGAGCSCILKPPEEAPAAALEVLKALLDAGLPPGVAQIVFGVPDQVSRHLLASPIIRKLSFTGSIAVGRHLMKLAADGMKRTTMELGGHAPVLVFEDADINQALNVMVGAKYRNAGQVCVSPTRFYVQESVYEPFVKGFTERAAALKVGDGLADGTQMGPMANPRRLDAMQLFIGDAERAGAKLRTGGSRIGNQGFFWQPTVLSDVPRESRIMNEEPFGPVALMVPFRTQEDAIAEANRLPYGLAAYAWTQSARRVNQLGDMIESGMIGINTNQIAGVDSPFGGVKESGHGSEDGLEGLEACLVTKAITQM